MRTIFHLDLDAFFVSVERILDPTLEGKPVIVGGDPHGRGVVAACSYEAREYGLHSAMPIRQAFKLCPHGVYLHGHHGEYSNFSRSVKKILEMYAPVIQQASIDEFYMDFTGTQKIYGSMMELASKIQFEIFHQLFLPCSIGIGSNKTIAKIASDCMKPKGITYVIAGMEKEFLAPMLVQTIPGVGKVTLKSLNTKGFQTIGDIANSSSEYFAAAFGQCGTDLWEKAHGKGTEYLTQSYEQKSISKETTFDEDVTDKKYIEEVIFNLTGKVCQQIRDNGWQAATISIKLRYSDFATITRAKTIKPTSDDKIVCQTAVDLFNKAYTRRVAIRLIGIHLTNFSESAEQIGLFDGEDSKRNSMFKAINELRNKYGFSSVKVGVDSIN